MKLLRAIQLTKDMKYINDGCTAFYYQLSKKVGVKVFKRTHQHYLREELRLLYKAYPSKFTPACYGAVRVYEGRKLIGLGILMEHFESVRKYLTRDERIQLVQKLRDITGIDRVDNHWLNFVMTKDGPKMIDFSPFACKEVTQNGKT